MDRSSPLNTLLLEAEDADQHASMTIASIAVFEGPQPEYEEFVETISGRLPLVPKYRQRLRRVPFDLATPAWTDDPRFDVRWHVRQTAVAPPGDDVQLRRLMGQVMAQRTDSDRPLWEYWIVAGLADGRWGLISKLHHSMVDGISGTELYRILFDILFDGTATPRPPEPDAWRPHSEPNPLRLMGDAVLTFRVNPLEGARAAFDALRHPRTAVRDLGLFAQGLMVYAATMIPAPASSTSGPVGHQRQFTWTRVSRRSISAIRKAFGGTFNDVVLAAITHGFRQVLITRGEAPRPNLLRSLVPVPAPAPDDEAIHADRVSSLLPFLPIHLADPIEQLAAISERLAALKASHEAGADRMLTSIATFPPFPAFAAPVRLIFTHPQRVAATVTTNVPGPRAPVYALGRRCVGIVPYVPIAGSARIGVSIFSYGDSITFGITGDQDATPDLDVLARGIETAFTSLVAAARAPKVRQEGSRRPRISTGSPGSAGSP